MFKHETQNLACTIFKECTHKNIFSRVCLSKILKNNFLKVFGICCSILHKYIQTDNGSFQCKIIYFHSF